MPLFCKDCGNYCPSSHWYDCSAHENAIINLVTGGQAFRFKAHDARLLESACGEQARWFKPLPDKENHHES